MVTALDTTFQELYEKLNEKQKLAVDTTEGPVMVLAGAGTGKTQTIAMRIANILQNPDLQMSPQNILCLTFTESAVIAMRKRLIEIIGRPAYYIKIHTFHSFCNEVIKDNPNKFLSMEFISELEQIELLQEIIDSLPATSQIKPYGEPYFYRNDLASCIKTLKRESIQADELLNVILCLEKFLTHNSNLIEGFISKHARSIKEEDCNAFIQELTIHSEKIDTKDIPLITKYSSQDLFTQYLNTIIQFKNNSQKISEFKKQVKDFYEKNLKSIAKQKDLVYVYRKFQEALSKRKLYDYEDMILNVIKAFQDDKSLQAYYQEQFQYILVDEYQDTNGSQNQILDLLTSFHKENPNLFVVGDDDQSVYRFQGASIENIIYFYKRYEQNVNFIVLEDNYRSHQQILDSSFSVVNLNQSRISNIIPNISKKLQARRKINISDKTREVARFEHGNVESIEFESINDEIHYISQQVLSLTQSGVDPSEIAILFRDNRDANNLAEQFNRRGIKFAMQAGNNILENIEINQLIDLFKLIESPQNGNLLFNVLNYNFIMKFFNYSYNDLFYLVRTRHQLQKQASDKNMLLIDVLIENPKFSAVCSKILELKQQSFNLKFDIFFEKVIGELGFLQYTLNKANKLEELNRLNTLFDEAKSLTRNYKKRNDVFSCTESDIFSLKDFIKYIDLIKQNNIKLVENALPMNKNAVNLMTAHKSKGLEFEYVFIHKCVDKHWGNKRSMSKLKLPPGLINESEALLANDTNEDERRLFYVALTRAKNKAYICHYKKNEKDKDVVPSIFTEEIHPNFVNKIKQEDLPELCSLDSNIAKLEANFNQEAFDDFLAKEKAFVEECLRDYKLSVTHINNYLKCPRLFFYQNLLKVPSAKNKHASFGTAIHAALYDLFLNYKSNSGTPSLNFLLASFEKHLSLENLNEQEFNESLEYGQSILTKYFNNYKDKFNHETLLEFDFGNKGINLDGIQLTGKLDKIEIIDHDNNSCKDINVVDYKTGNPVNKSAELKPGGNYHRQVTFYKLLCDLANSSGQFNYNMISGEIDFIQAGKDDKFLKQQIIISKDDTENLKREIKNIYDEIINLNFEKTDDKNLCTKCSFNNICNITKN